MEKAPLRSEMNARLRACPAPERATASAAIRRSLHEHFPLDPGSAAAVFDPLPSEPDLLPFARELIDRGVRVGFPRCIADGGLEFHAVQSESQLLPVANRRYREPDPGQCAAIEPGAIDLLIVPGLAFSRGDGRRLGRGGGSYDRFLAEPEFRGRPVGVCFGFQLVGELPVEEHDLPVDGIVTESGLIAANEH